MRTISLILSVIILLYMPKSIIAQLPLTDLKAAQEQLISYDSLEIANVMVVGTFHFNDAEILEEKNQKEIQKLISALAEFDPTKVVLEWEPSAHLTTNKAYQAFLQDSFSIQEKINEVYQLGFRLAEAAGHDSIYFFDDQTEYIGSLENFSFDSFIEQAEQMDPGFYNKHQHVIVANHNQNQSILKKFDLYDRIALLNSPTAQEINEKKNAHV